MFKNKLIKELRDEINWLVKRNEIMVDEIDNLKKKLSDQKEMQEKKSRKQILKEYDVAVLIKNGKTYLLEKGKEEKMIRSFTLTQYENNVPILETEKVLYERLY